MSVPIKLANARLAACRKMPYLSTAILSMIPVSRPGMGTMGVSSRWVLVYDPEFIENTPPDELAGVVLHEVAHLVLKHHKRCQALVNIEMTPLFNAAADCAINEMLRSQGVKLPEGFLYPETFKLPTGQPAEVYYRMLLDQAKKPEDMPKTPFAGGSCSDGVPREWEIVADENEEAGTVNETDASMNKTVGEVNKNTVSVNNQPGYEDYEIEQILRKTAEAMQRGTVPGCFKRAAEEILNPKVDPRRLLMRALQRHTSTLMNGGGKYSYRRPARRPSLGGTIRPRAFQPIPKITVIVDTSGSMNERDLGLCVGFVAKVLSGLRLRDGVHVIVGDAQVQGDMQCLDAKKLKLSGGGGTSMKRLIEHAASAKDKPGLIIVCTDSETDWSNRDLGIPVVACLTRESSPVPSWIEKVVMG